MCHRLILIIILFPFFSFCSKKDVLYQPSDKVDPYVVYKEGLEAFENNDFFYAEKKFSEAEINFLVNPELAAKSAIMSSFSLWNKFLQRSGKKFTKIYRNLSSR